jgi:hypothetical protein
MSLAEMSTFYRAPDVYVIDLAFFPARVRSNVAIRPQLGGQIAIRNSRFYNGIEP